MPIHTATDFRALPATGGVFCRAPFAALDCPANGSAPMLQDNRVIFRCPGNLLRTAQASARRNDMTLSDYLRDLIRRDQRTAA